MFLLLYFMLMRKNVIYTTEKQNMTSDFVSVCCCIINLTLTFTPHQTGIFLEILFKIRNQHKILRKKVE